MKLIAVKTPRIVLTDTLGLSRQLVQQVLLADYSASGARANPQALRNVRLQPAL